MRRSLWRKWLSFVRKHYSFYIGVILLIMGKDLHIVFAGVGIICEKDMCFMENVRAGEEHRLTLPDMTETDGLVE